MLRGKAAVIVLVEPLRWVHPTKNGAKHQSAGYTAKRRSRRAGGVNKEKK